MGKRSLQRRWDRDGWDGWRGRADRAWVNGGRIGGVGRGGKGAGEGGELSSGGVGEAMWCPAGSRASSFLSLRLSSNLSV